MTNPKFKPLAKLLEFECAGCKGHAVVTHKHSGVVTFPAGWYYDKETKLWYCSYCRCE